MRSRKAKSKAIMYKGFLHLHRSLLECQDFISLKGNSIKLPIALVYAMPSYRIQIRTEIQTTLFCLNY